MVELTDQNIAACERELNSLVTGSDMIAGAVLSTQDGLLVTSASVDRNIEPDSIAAMSSSLLSLADALAGQAGKALANNVISQADSSTLVLLHAGGLILTVVGQAEINIGLVLTSARRTAHAIDKATKEFGETVKEREEIAVKGLEMLEHPEMLLERIKNEMAEMKKRREERA